MTRKNVILVGAILIALMIAFPPFESYVTPSRGTKAEVVRSEGYAFIGSPPAPESRWSIRVNVGTLLLQIGAVVVIAGAGAFFVGEED